MASIALAGPGFPTKTLVVAAQVLQAEVGHAGSRGWFGLTLLYSSGSALGSFRAGHVIILACLFHEVDLGPGGLVARG